MYICLFVCGCNPKYKLTIEDSEYIVLKPEKRRLSFGDSITLKTVMLDNEDIELYLNEEIVRTRSYIVEDGVNFWQYKFNMPKKDSTIKISTKEKKKVNIKDISTNEEVTLYYANDINGTLGSAHLNEKQIEIFNEMYSKLLTTEAYQDVYCNCESKISVNYRYNHIDNGKVIDCFYSIAYHDHGITVWNHSGYYQVIESDTFNRQLVLDMLGLFYVLEDDYIIEEYDKLKGDELEKVYLESPKWPNDFGFGDVEGHIYGSAESYEEAVKKFKARVKDNKDYKYEYSLIEENKFYYLINAKQTYVKNGNIYDIPVIYYKNNIFDYENNMLYTKDTNEMKKIMDHTYLSGIYNILGSEFFASQIIDKGEYYLYVIYSAQLCGGDWGISDTITYSRITNVISKDGLIEEKESKLIDIIYGDYMGVAR
jgi:hypothetical protein